jgi:hypothetical protein
MIWTDPPYGHGNMDGDLQAARVRDGVKGGRIREVEPIANDSGQGFWDCMDDFFDQASRVLNRDCCCCCCCCGGGPKPTFARLSLLADYHMEFFHAVVWDKSARGNGMGWRYRRNYEFVMVSHRKSGRLRWNESQEAVPNVVRHCPVIDRVHPNEKPVDLVADFVSWHTLAGDLVADTFLGSGSSGVAAVRLNRRFYGIELNERYFAIAQRRIQEALNSQPLFKDQEIERQEQLF